MSTNKGRIYAVVTNGETRLVSAFNRLQAISHVAKSTINASVPSQMQLVEAVSKGIKVEYASQNPENGELDFESPEGCESVAA
jgi:hypothetical protein